MGDSNRKSGAIGALGIIQKQSLNPTKKFVKIQGEFAPKVEICHKCCKIRVAVGEFVNVKGFSNDFPLFF